MQPGIINKIARNLNKDLGIKTLHYLAKKSFHFFERYFQLHITPAHFYSPIPQMNYLDSTVYEKKYDCTGIDWNVETQLVNLRKVFPKYFNEFFPDDNTGLSLVDAFILYAMVREKKPRVMVEIGAGESTKISLKALGMNKKEGHSFKFYAIEPYPWEELRHIDDQDFHLIDKKLQKVDIELVSSADLLFIDSSHVSKIDSDVNHEILEVIPKLKVGSIVHWHDIVIPTNYWKEWVECEKLFWNESYMVHSFMLFNESFKIMWAARYMKLNYFETLQQHFPYLENPHRLMSFWIERVK